MAIIVADADRDLAEAEVAAICAAATTVPGLSALPASALKAAVEEVIRNLQDGGTEDVFEHAVQHLDDTGKIAAVLLASQVALSDGPVSSAQAAVLDPMTRRLGITPVRQEAITRMARHRLSRTEAGR